MSRYSYDTEFLEDGTTIELISIGIVADDGREYYAVNRDAPWKRIYKHRWLCDNVVPSLPQIRGDRRNHVPVRSNPYALDFQHRDMKNRLAIGSDVQRFLLSGESVPDLWAYYAAYDHVALCQLFGAMIDLPSGIPMYTHDLMQEIDRVGLEPPEQESGHHNALDDARWVHTSLLWLAAQEVPS